MREALRQLRLRVCPDVHGADLATAARGLAVIVHAQMLGVFSPDRFGGHLADEVDHRHRPRQRGLAQGQAADGADMIAALRYAIMSHYKGGEGDVEVQQPLNPNIDYGLEKLAARVKEEIVR